MGLRHPLIGRRRAGTNPNFGRSHLIAECLVCHQRKPLLGDLTACFGCFCRGKYYRTGPLPPDKREPPEGKGIYFVVAVRGKKSTVMSEHNDIKVAEREADRVREFCDYDEVTVEVAPAVT